MNEPGRVPPRFVPVLTEVIDPAVAAAAVPPSVPVPVPVPMAVASPSPSTPDALRDQLVQRVMQRVDGALARELHEAVASMVLQHTHALVPRLREEIELVVRQAVAEAVAAELAQRPTA
ncbi:MAG TPA: hypothetical protein VMS38_14115 [Pseudorhodoferax sp.]|nr:hypothetical protein [Pseudorhodoferax sp.]